MTVPDGVEETPGLRHGHVPTTTAGYQVPMTDLGRVLGVTPNTMSRIERGIEHDTDGARRALAHLAERSSAPAG